MLNSTDPKRDEKIQKAIKKAKYEWWIKQLNNFKEQKSKLHKDYILASQNLELERSAIADFNNVLNQPVSADFMQHIEQLVDAEWATYQSKQAEEAEVKRKEKEQREANKQAANPRGRPKGTPKMLTAEKMTMEELRKANPAITDADVERALRLEEENKKNNVVFIEQDVPQKPDPIPIGNRKNPFWNP